MSAKSSIKLSRKTIKDIIKHIKEYDMLNHEFNMFSYTACVFGKYIRDTKSSSVNGFNCKEYTEEYFGFRSMLLEEDLSNEKYKRVVEILFSTVDGGTVKGSLWIKRAKIVRKLLKEYLEELK